MKKIVEELRDGIFALNTRRFGTIAELVIASKYGFEKSINQFHDAYDIKKKQRIEIKFSRAMKANEKPITLFSASEQCINADLSNRALESRAIHRFSFDSNIQQVKCVEFDVLYYGLFFSDKIAIFKAKSEQVKKMKGYSDKQHKNNVGEGQFHLNQDSIDYHFENFFVEWLTYEELHKLFSNESKKKK